MTEIERKLIQHRREGNVLVIEVLVPEIRMLELSHELRAQLSEVFESIEPASIVFDVAQVEFLGSLGVLAFLSVRRDLPDARIMIVNASKQVQELLNVCRLVPREPTDYTPFEIGEDVPSAIAAMN